MVILCNCNKQLYVDNAILQEHSEEELKAWKLERVSEDFRVIALGLPVPRYHGNPLDPPLRSRFQARDIHLLPFKVGVLNYWSNIMYHKSKGCILFEKVCP